MFNLYLKLRNEMSVDGSVSVLRLQEKAKCTGFISGKKGMCVKLLI